MQTLSLSQMFIKDEIWCSTIGINGWFLRYVHIIKIPISFQYLVSVVNGGWVFDQSMYVALMVCILDCYFTRYGYLFVSNILKLQHDIACIFSPCISQKSDPDACCENSIKVSRLSQVTLVLNGFFISFCVSD